MPLPEVQRRLIKVDPVSKKETQVNHNVAEVSAAGVADKSSPPKGQSGVYLNVHYPWNMIKQMTQEEKDELMSGNSKQRDRMSLSKAQKSSSFKS